MFAKTTFGYLWIGGPWNPQDLTARFAEGAPIVELPFEEVKRRAIPIQTEAAAP